MVEITFDPFKRNLTLSERGLDFADAHRVFAGPKYTGLDARFDYGEPRYITVGHLAERMVVIVWTPRGETRRIISMRKANEREQARYAGHIGDTGT
ncbi:MAG: BrnT family toxin [Phreatobacter sp.]|nr:BrnT family toxin [Phreatobacter sp.]